MPWAAQFRADLAGRCPFLFRVWWRLALDNLRPSVDALRVAVEATARRPAEVYLEDLQHLHERGLIDKESFVRKRKDFLDRL